MVRKILCMLILLLALTSVIVSAVNTEIKVETYANHDVFVNVYDHSKEDPIATFSENSGSSGRIIFNFSSDISKVDLYTIVRKEGKIIFSKKFESCNTGGQIKIELVKEEVQEATVNITASTNLTSNETSNTTPTNSTENETVNETTNTTTSESIEETNADITGAWIPKKDEFFSKYFYFIVFGVLAVIIAGGIVFLVLKMTVMRKPLGLKDIKIRKYSEIKDEIEGKPSSEDDKKILDLENQVKELQKEIDEIKNKKNKIKEAEEKLRRDMKELERLKK